MIPSRPIVPVLVVTAARENVTHPLAVIMPGLRVQLGEAAQKKEKSSKNKKLEDLFDGRRGKEIQEPVRPAQIIGLPEQDLEKEIGAY